MAKIIDETLNSLIKHCRRLLSKKSKQLLRGWQNACWGRTGRSVLKEDERMSGDLLEGCARKLKSLADIAFCESPVGENAELS